MSVPQLQSDVGVVPMPVLSPAVVSASGLVRRYGEGDTAVNALRDVSIEIEEARLTAIMGPSGSGKSTLMHILAGLDKPSEGSVSIAGVEITGMNDKQLTRLRRDHIGFVFQFFNLLPMLTAEENILLPLSIAGEKPEREWLEELLETVGINGRRKHRPSRALGRAAAARLDRPRPDLEAVGAVRRRADRQPRLQHQQGRPRASPSLGRGARPDDRDGHPRRERSRARRPDPLPRRRPDRQGSPRLDGSRSARRHAGGERTMIAVALKGLLGRKTRAILTALAIVLGTGMVSATFIFTDTLNQAFNGVFSKPYEQASVVVSGKQIVTGAANTPSVPASLVARIRAVPGVEAASGGFLFATVKLVGANGKAIGNGGPQFGFGVDPADKRFTPLALTTGRWPSGPGEIAIGAVTAAKEHFAVGDTIGAKGTGRVHHYTITGLAEIPGVSSGSATLAALDVSTAQVLLGKQGRYDSISVVGSPDVTPRALAARIRPLLSETETVRTSAAEAASVNKSVTGGLSGIKYILLAFGGIALFVGAFVIFNTISMTVAQRTRELATLRTLGASRRQVLRSVLLESAVIGALASLFGLVLGLGLFKALEALFTGLPQAGTVFSTQTVVVTIVLGTGITLLAGLFPALRATRVPPIAAVREGAVLPVGRFHRYKPYVAGVVIVLAVLAIAAGVLSGGGREGGARPCRGRDAAALHRCGDDLESPRRAADPRRRGARSPARWLHGPAGFRQLRT